MLGVIITFFGSFFEEIANSITKEKIIHDRASIYSLGLINSLTVTAVFIFVNLVSREFRFSLESLPTIGLRAVLEIILITIALTAVGRTDRSTHGFIRVLTIPLLLIVDLALGYKLNILQLAGIGVIIASLFLVFMNHGIIKKGAGLTLITAVLAVATISLYKYDISHYNSVAAEQLIIHLALFIYLGLMAYFKNKENPFMLLKQRLYCYSSLANAAPGLLISYAYSLAPASVVISAYRSASVFWAVVSGQAYFKEKHFLVKALCLALLVGGLILLAIK